MPAKKGGTRKAPKRPSTASLQKEIHELSDALEALHDDVQKLTPQKPWQRALEKFLGGVLRGVGFIFGSTIIAALLLFGAQKALESTKVQTWINEQVAHFIENLYTSVVENNDVPNIDVPFLND